MAKPRKSPGSVKRPVKKANKKSSSEDSGFIGGDIMQGAITAVFVEGPLSEFAQLGLSMWCPGLASALFGGDPNAEVMAKLDEVLSGISEVKEMVRDTHASVFNLAFDVQFSKIAAEYTIVNNDFEYYKSANTPATIDGYLEWVKLGRKGKENLLFNDPVAVHLKLYEALDILKRGILETKTPQGENQFLLLLRNQLKDLSLVRACKHTSSILDEVYGAFLQASMICETIIAQTNSTIIHPTTIDKSGVIAHFAKDIGLISDFTDSFNEEVKEVLGNMTQIIAAIKDGWYGFQIRNVSETDKYLQFNAPNHQGAAISFNSASCRKYRFHFDKVDLMNVGTNRTLLRSTEWLYGTLIEAKDYRDFALQLLNQSPSRGSGHCVCVDTMGTEPVDIDGVKLTPIRLNVVANGGIYKRLDKWYSSEFVRASDGNDSPNQKWLLQVAPSSSFVNNSVIYLKSANSENYIKINADGSVVASTNKDGCLFRVYQDPGNRNFRLQSGSVKDGTYLSLAVAENGTLQGETDANKPSVWFSLQEFPSYFVIFSIFNGRYIRITDGGVAEAGPVVDRYDGNSLPERLTAIIYQ